MGFFDKIKKGLSKTTQAMGSVFGVSRLDDDFYDQLEETLILSDMGVESSTDLVEKLRARVKEKKLRDGGEARLELAGLIAERLNTGDPALKLDSHPAVILVVGVNGVGKTTTIGKLAVRFRAEGKRVLLCAGDTFRAAAAEQLKIWADRAKADIVAQSEGSDPAAVVFDGIAAAKARNVDVVIVDTAGRLHNKQNLMNELSKISRVIRRELPDADMETLLAMDATTGQNGLIQAKQFGEVAELTGIVLTKLDGTAKGGIVVAVADEMALPVKYIGVGEGVDDLMPFESEAFAKALLEVAE